jgi:transcription elongation factor Elf1
MKLTTCPDCGTTDVRIGDLDQHESPYRSCHVECNRCGRNWHSRAEHAVLAGMGFTNTIALRLSQPEAHP